MIPLPILEELEALLLSDHVTIKGSRLIRFIQILQAVQQEKTVLQTLLKQGEVRPPPKPPDSEPPHPKPKNPMEIVK
jgi:hypothetical protein